MKNFILINYILPVAISVAFILSFPSFSTPYLVTSPADGGAGSLREALTLANADIAGAPHSITFNGVMTITVVSNLPAIMNQTAINGGTTGNIIITGATAAVTSGLLINTLNSSGSSIQNLVLNTIAGSAITVQSPAAAVTIANCWLGLDAAGAPVPNTTAITIIGPGAANTITGNCIAGNSASSFRGISVEQNSVGNIIQGNKIGFNGADVPFGIRGFGIYIGDGCNNNIIGGDHAAGEGNVISGCIGDGDLFGTVASGIFIQNSSGHIIKGNYIGTNVAGTSAGAPLQNNGSGIEIRNGSNITLGSLNVAEQNVISGNNQFGIAITNGSTLNRIEGNYLGTDATGTNGSFGNKSSNILVQDAPLNVIHANVSCGSLQAGIYIMESDRNTITSNIVGLNATQTVEYGNNWDAIGLDFSSNYNMIGGVSPADGNVCCGGRTAVASGIAIKNSGVIHPSIFNTVLNNYCGVSSTGTPFGNDNFGIYLGYFDAISNVIGKPGMGNTVAYNSKGGIWLENAGTAGNSIRGNSIYCNGTSTTIGINLNSASNDYPTNPAPVLNGDPDALTVYGTVAAGDTIDLYQIDACNSCSYPQGKTYITTIISDLITGSWSYTAASGTDLLSITATNTQKTTGSTSEFSTCATILPILLLSFTATVSGNDVVLRWSTASERNNHYFIIQRSIDGIHFDNIDTISGQGNSNKTLQYSYADQSPLLGTVYYRLKQVDYSGRYTYSLIRAITISDAAHTVIIYPNPVKANEDITINISNVQENETVTIHVYDAVGKSVWNLSGKNTSQYVIRETSISAGVYLFSIRIGSYSTVQKVIVY